MITDIDFILELMTKASNVAFRHFHERTYEVSDKDDGTPVSTADLDVNRVLVEGVSHLGWPIISEEGPQDRGDTFWLIDPIDGTKEFLSQRADFTVNLGLVHQGIPVAGFISNPVTAELFWGTAEDGAFRRELKREGEQLVVDGPTKAIRTRPLRLDAITVVTSKYVKSTFVDRIVNLWPGAQLESFSSSIKFCRIAEGGGDIYVRRAKMSEWDVGAGHAILAAAGGKVVNFRDGELTYNSPNLDLESFCALGDRSISPETFIQRLY